MDEKVNTFEIDNQQPSFSSSTMKYSRKNMGELYLITGPNNKRYVGQTLMQWSNGRDHDSFDRFEEHIRESKSKNSGCLILNNAIRKYGRDTFSVRVLLRSHSSLLNAFEIVCIKIYKTQEPNGYNIRSGGSRGRFSKESRKRMSLSKMGKKNHNYGKPRSLETKKKISQKKSGVNHHFYGKHLSLDHRKKLSIVRKKYDKTLPMYMCYLKARPTHYVSEGYGIFNHPTGAKKQWTSKYLTLKEKYKLALEYLHELNKG